MRSLKITVFLFSLLIICIILNSLYIHSCADGLENRAEALLMGAEAGELEVFWESNKKYVGISVSEAQIDNISRLIVSARFNQKHGNISDLEKDVALLIQAAEGLRKYEEITVENIF